MVKKKAIPAKYQQFLIPIENSHFLNETKYSTKIFKSSIKGFK